MSNSNVRMALSSLRSARWRSLLTMFGIIIGVIAVVITLSIGEGVKRQITDQLDRLGQNVIVVRPGGSTTRANTYVGAAGVFAGLTTSPLTASDLAAVKNAPGVKAAVPLGVGSGFATVNNQKLDGGSVIATNEQLAQVLNQPVEHGTFFNANELNSNVVVIGRTVAEELFQENAPIGRTLTIRGQDFIVRGVFDQFNGNPLALGTDLNRAVFIPYSAAAGLSDGTVPIAEIFAQVEAAQSVDQAAEAVRQNLTVAHAGQQDFSVLSRNQDLQASSNTVTIITQLVSAVAALSLLVGGIGIINIMLVSVTERTREIGIRKAVGATNRQILNQFLVEAATLSAVGGLIGILLALLGIFLIRIGTNLHPIVTWPVVILVPVIAWLVGIIFGVAPAIKAARKDPIDALRYE